MDPPIFHVHATYKISSFKHNMRFLSFPAAKNVTDGQAQTKIMCPSTSPVGSINIKRVRAQNFAPVFTLSSTTEFFGQRRQITNELRDPELSITVKNMGPLIIRPSKTYFVVSSGRLSVRPLNFRVRSITLITFKIFK